jgi:two-component system, NarL family, sensor histidine kinase UhpB
VLLEVSDTGTGLPVAHRPGVGLSGMRERAEELDGSIAVESGPGGVTVTAHIPRRAAV